MKSGSRSTRRRLMAVGNWKMHKTVAESVEFVKVLSRELDGLKGVDVMIAPPFPVLYPLWQEVKGTPVSLAGQDLFWEEQGAYTGEVSALQLSDSGCEAVLIGHSERRRSFSETNETVCRKLKAALQYNLVPIVCVGETLEQRKEGRTADVLNAQIGEGLKGITPQQSEKVVVAYEPVWAIGTGQVASPEQVAESHQLIRRRISDIFGSSGDRIRILYGGSVSPQNIKELSGIDGLDGVLVGGASLNTVPFVEIIRGLLSKVKEK